LTVITNLLAEICLHSRVLAGRIADCKNYIDNSLAGLFADRLTAIANNLAGKVFSVFCSDKHFSTPRRNQYISGMINLPMYAKKNASEKKNITMIGENRLRDSPYTPPIRNVHAITLGINPE
jgi:hypothetical protein